MSVLSMRKLGVRTVARRVAKRTAKGLTKSYVLGKPPPGEWPSGVEGRLGVHLTAHGCAYAKRSHMVVQQDCCPSSFLQRALCKHSCFSGPYKLLNG